MADKKVSALTAATTLASADLAHVITSVATTPTNNKVTLLNTFNKVPTFLGFSGTGIQAYTAATSAVTATGGLILVTTPSTAATPALADGVAGQRVAVFTATRGWVVTDESSGVAPVSTSLILTKA